MGTRDYIAGLICLIAMAVGQPVPGAGPLDVLGRLGKDRPGAAREFLEPDAAFVLTVDAGRDDTVRLDWRIEPGYYLYRDKMKVEALSPGLPLGEVRLPAGELKNDPAFGEVEIYRDAVALEIPVEAGPASESGRMRVTYQGCAEDGICYPPIKKEIPIALNLLDTAAAAPAGSRVRATQSESDRIAAELAAGSLPLAIASFYVFGLLLAFTPCVFPMVPILSGIIVGQRERVTVKRGFALSGVYVLAMAAAYAAAGVAAALFGRNFQAAFQDPRILVAFSAVFVALALSMFGLYELKLPAAWQTHLDGLSRSRAGGTYTGVAAMGLLSAVIVGPCVAPPLAGALFYLGHQGSPVVGGGALFAMGLGMGTPLLALGASAGKLLPKAGVWMDAVKRVFGVVLLGVAIWFLARILPGPAAVALWALLAIGAAVFMGALDRLGEAAGGWRRLRKGLGLAVLGYGVVLIVGASAGADDPLRPLKPLTDRNRGTPVRGLFSEIKGTAGLDAALMRASQLGKPALLDVYADWCIECKHLERHTFEAEIVRDEFAQWSLLRADVTAHDERDRALLESLGLYGPPAVLFFDATGAEQRDQRLLGFVGPHDFASHLKAVRQRR